MIAIIWCTWVVALPPVVCRLEESRQATRSESFASFRVVRIVSRGRLRVVREHLFRANVRDGHEAGSGFADAKACGKRQSGGIGPARSIAREVLSDRGALDIQVHSAHGVRVWRET